MARARSLTLAPALVLTSLTHALALALSRALSRVRTRIRAHVLFCAGSLKLATLI